MRPWGMLFLFLPVLLSPGCTEDEIPTEPPGWEEQSARAEAALPVQMLPIPAGEFLMGSAPTEPGRLDEPSEAPDGDLLRGRHLEGGQANEGPQHKVTIARSFLIGRTEVTNAQYQLFAEATQGHAPAWQDPESQYYQEGRFGFPGSPAAEQFQVLRDTISHPEAPVAGVTWFDAVAFCNWLSAREGLKPCYRGKRVLEDGAFAFVSYTDGATWVSGCTGYRLPTEAEWEYAARAGSTTGLATGDLEELGCGLDLKLDRVGWYCGNSGGHPHEVGKKEPNKWGLFDMHGNVWEWVWDWDHDYGTEALTGPRGPEAPVATTRSSSETPLGTKIARGGAFDTTAAVTRSAMRGGLSPGGEELGMGFRVARDIRTQAETVFKSDRPNRAVASNSITVSNSPPSILSTGVSPSGGYETTTFRCRPNGWQDVDKDPPGYHRIWAVSGNPSVQTESITGRHFDKGDSLICTLTPNDGEDDGPPVSSPPVTILNSPPTTTRVDIDPPEGNEATTFSCRASGWNDVDGDPAGFTWSWSVNGTPSGTTQTIGGSAFASGDSIQCAGTPFDGTDPGRAVRSKKLTIANSPPSLAMSNISPGSGDEDTTYSCRTSGWKDEDGDAPGYTWAWTVNGIPSVTTPQIPNTAFGEGDVLLCVATPYDGTESGRPVPSAAVVVSNPPPTVAEVEITPASGDESSTFTCRASDGKSDTTPYSYQWIINGTPSFRTQSITGAQFNKGDILVCTATPLGGVIPPKE